MTNALARETSPYLLQHADNPVDWLPWSQQSLDLAKQKNKPIMLSIGYAACHWCHVMAHESFEDDAIAAVMNELFVNIKVDREERPDLDTIYQSSLAMFGGQGGWPLTMFCTPDGKPFWGGTYFPDRRARHQHDHHRRDMENDRAQSHTHLSRKSTGHLMARGLVIQRQPQHRITRPQRASTRSDRARTLATRQRHRLDPHFTNFALRQTEA